MASTINNGYELAITPPEEGAGAAYRAVETGLLGTFHIASHTLPMDLATRVLTNSKAVADASQYVKDHPNSTYVKGPGITPRNDQTLDTVIWLESQGKLQFSDAEVNDKVAALRASLKPGESENNIIEFAYKVAGSTADIEYRGHALAKQKGILDTIGSPNASWRDALQANLSRGASEELAKRSLVQPAKWDASTPLTISAFPATESENMLTRKVSKGQKLKMVFVSASGAETEIATHTMSDGTYARLFTQNEQAVKDWVSHQLDAVPPGTKLINGTKQTVLKTFDVNQLKWMSQVVIAKGRNDDIDAIAKNKKGQGFSDELLVDDVFARLAAKAPEAPTLMLSPNPSYAAYVKDVWDGIKAKGGFKIPKNSEVIRAAATGDEYIDSKKTEFQAPEKGTMKIVDESGAVVMEKSMEKGDVSKFIYFDRKRVHDLIVRTLESAKSSGRTNVILGFDDDEYYRSAIEEYKSVAGNYADLNVRVMPSAEATAEYFTAGVQNTTLALSNIRGDFATDIEMFGKGTSYSTGVIYDGRKVVELGAGGTAPDLLAIWRDRGALQFNPMAFVEGISLALKFSAETMHKKSADASATIAVSDAIEKGMYATTDNGIVNPIVKGKFSKRGDVEYTSVSTPTFVKSVELEAMKYLQKTNQEVAARLQITPIAIAKAEGELARMIAIDTAIFAATEKFGGKNLGGGKYEIGRWERANIAYHTAREKAGKIDPLHPDYTISLPDEADPSKLSADTMMALQEARANVVGAMEGTGNVDIAKKSLKDAFVALGVPEKQADFLLTAETERFTANTNAKSAA